jgi:dimethylargininase
VSVVAIVREVSASFAQALSATPPDPPIDVPRARAQHAAYVEALRRAGADVIVLPAVDELPDACFVEDCAVVAGGLALIARPGAPSRRDEPASVRQALARLVPVAEMAAPETLDGGDCLLLGTRLYVGRSARTNSAGAARARAVFGRRGIEVVEVEVRDALHLKSVCSPIGDAVLVAEGALPPGTFPRELTVGSPVAANVVVVGGCALVPVDAEDAARRVAEIGLEPLRVDNRELRKADSALTCLSILVPGPSRRGHRDEGVGSAESEAAE